MSATRCTCIGVWIRGRWVVEVADPACGATHEPPKLSDLFGIDPTFTGDLSTEEYLRQNRGEA